MFKYLLGTVLAFGLTSFADARAQPTGAPPTPSVCGNVTLTAGTSTSNVALPIGPGNCSATTVLNDGTIEAFIQIGNISVSASIPTPGTVTQTIAIPPGQSVPITGGGSKGTYVAAITASGSTTLRITQANGSVPYTGGAGSGGGSGGTVTAIQPVGSLLHMTCDSGCSSSSAPADTSTFTPTVTSQTPVGGFFQSAPTSNPLGNEQMGAFQVTAYRALMENPRSSNGVELGTLSNPMQVSLTSTGFNATSLSVVANAGSNLNTSLLALESGGNLANVSSAVTAGVMQENVRQIGSVAVLAGSGAVGAGAQRVAVAQDTSTMAGSAPGTAGSPSAQVGSIQGVSGGTAVPVSGSVTATQATGSNLHIVCDSGCSSSTAPADEAPFTAGTTSQTPVGGFFQTTATSNPLTTGQMGAFQVTANRALMINPRNSSGVEIGTASAPMQVSLANTAVNATSLNAAITGTLPAFTATPTFNLGTLNGAATAANQEVTAAGTTATSAQGVQGVTGGVAMNVAQATGSNLHIVCDSGCSSSTAPADESTFTPGTTSQTPIGGFYQTTATSNPLTTGKMGTPQLTQYRALMVNNVTAAGVEIGTAASPTQVSLANTGANSTPLVVTANAGTNLNTSALALESGGNLATVASAVTSSTMQENIKQVNGTTALAGVGAVGTGSIRVAVGQDSTTLAGSPPGTSGTPSGAVVTVQGPTSGGIAVPVSGTVAATQSGTWNVGVTGAVPLPTGAATAANQEVTAAGTTATSAQGVQGVTGGVAMPVTATNLSTNMAQVAGGSTATAATGVQKVGIVGNAGAAVDFAGQNAASPANAILGGAQFNTSPTTITSGNVSPLQADSAGNLKVNLVSGGTVAQGASSSGVGGSLIMGISSATVQPIIQSDKSVAINISTATTTQLVALASGQKIYVTRYDVIAGGTGTFQLEYGTGTNCGTGTTVLTGAYPWTAQTGLTTGGGLGSIYQIPASNALCAVTNAATSMTGSVSYTQF